jgi:hypothetical protein
VQLAANFGSYTSVFGAGDGIIYGIGQDGTLSWYRHSNLTAGGGPSALERSQVRGLGLEPICVRVRRRQRRDLRGAERRHRSLVAPSGLSHGRFNPSDRRRRRPPQAGGRALTNRLPPRAEAHWQGPIKVASGWTGLRSVVAAGGGVILAVKADGSVLWYKHDNYLTGQSTAAPAASQNAAAPVAASLHNATAPNWGTLGSPSSTGSGFGQGSMAGGAGSTASAWRTSSSLGTPMNNSTQGAPGAPISSLSRSRGFDGQAAQMQGTQPATALNGSTLNGSTLNANTPGKVPAPTAAGQPQWEGPITIGAGWQRFPLIAAVLPTTVNAPIR